jgi:hypothetical protein
MRSKETFWAAAPTTVSATTMQENNAIEIL